MSLREEQRELTRSKILSAVLDLVGEGAMSDLSVPMVSERSGVSVATIYRYFPTKDALLDAAAQEPALRGAGRPTTEVGDGPEFLRAMWEDFANHVDLVRRQVASDTGRELRNRRLESSQGYFAAAVAGQGIDPDSEDGRRLVRLSLLLTSSVAFLDLHDRQGLTPAEAVDHVTWAIEALHHQTKRKRRTA